MANLSFTTSGATPFPSVGGMFAAPAANALSASTPAAKALNGGMSAYRPTTPPPPTPAPSTPVKSTTVNNADGSSHTTVFHAPEKTGVLSPDKPQMKTDAPKQQNPPTFPGLIGGLSGASTQGSATAPGYIQKTADYGAGNLPIEDRANKISDYYQSQAQSVIPTLNQAEGELTTGTAPVAEGNSMNSYNSATNRLAALSASENAALTPLNQSLTAQNQAANAANSAAGQAQTGQGLVQSGLTSAGGLAKPELGAIGQVPFSPTDLSQGSPLGAPGGTAADAAKVAGQFQGAQAAAAAPGQTQAQNIQTTGTAQSQAYNSVYAKATSDAANYSQQRSAINAVGNQAIGLMQSDPTINKFALQFGNQKINQLQSQLSSPQYAAFNTAIQSLQARIGQALQAGEIPTAATGNAQSIANGNITLSALASTLQQVDKEMGSFVGTQQALADYAKGQMQGGGNSSGGGNDPLGIL